MATYLATPPGHGSFPPTLWPHRAVAVDRDGCQQRRVSWKFMIWILQMLRFNALHGRLEEKLPAIMSQRTLDKLESIHVLSLLKYGSWRKMHVIRSTSMYWVFMLFFPARTDVFYWQDATPCCNIGTHQHLLSSNLAHRRFCEMSSFQ